MLMHLNSGLAADGWLNQLIAQQRPWFHEMARCPSPITNVVEFVLEPEAPITVALIQQVASTVFNFLLKAL